MAVRQVGMMKRDSGLQGLDQAPAENSRCLALNTFGSTARLGPEISLRQTRGKHLARTLGFKKHQHLFAGIDAALDIRKQQFFRVVNIAVG